MDDNAKPKSKERRPSWSKGASSENLRKQDSSSRRYERDSPGGSRKGYDVRSKENLTRSARDESYNRRHEREDDMNYHGRRSSLRSDSRDFSENRPEISLSEQKPRDKKMHSAREQGYPSRKEGKHSIRTHDNINPSQNISDRSKSKENRKHSVDEGDDGKYERNEKTSHARSDEYRGSPWRSEKFGNGSPTENRRQAEYEDRRKSNRRFSETTSEESLSEQKSEDQKKHSPRLRTNPSRKEGKESERRHGNILSSQTIPRKRDSFDSHHSPGTLEGAEASSDNDMDLKHNRKHENRRSEAAAIMDPPNCQQCEPNTRADERSEVIMDPLNCQQFKVNTSLENKENENADGSGMTSKSEDGTQEQVVGNSDAAYTHCQTPSVERQSLPEDETREVTQDKRQQDSSSMDDVVIISSHFQDIPPDGFHRQESNTSELSTDVDGEACLKAVIEKKREKYEKKMTETYIVNKGKRIAEANKKVQEWLGMQTFLDGLKGEVNRLKGEVKGLKDEVKGLNGEVNGLRGDVESKDARIKDLCTKQEQKDEINSKMQSELSQKETALDEKDKRFKETENKMRNLQMELEKYQNELAGEREMFTEQKQNLEDAEDAIRKLEEKRRQLKLNLEEESRTVDRLRKHRNELRDDNEIWAPSHDRPMHIILPEGILGDSRVNDLVYQLLKDLRRYVQVDEHYKNLSRLKSTDPGTIVVPCVAASRVESDISATLEAQSLGPYVQVVLILYHHVAPDKGCSIPSATRSNSRYNYPACLQILDAFFWNDDLYDCRANRDAVDRLLRICQAHTLIGK